MAYEERLNDEAIELTDETASEPLFEAEADLTEGDFAEEMDIEFEIENEVAQEKPKGRVATAVKQAKDTVQEKYDEARLACKDLMDRLNYDLQQTGYNPYIRTTTTRKIEVLRSSTDPNPVDVFEFENTKGFSLRSMAITVALVAAADVATKLIIKKKLF